MPPGSAQRQSRCAMPDSTNGSHSVIAGGQWRRRWGNKTVGLHLAIEALGIKHSGGATGLADLISVAVADDRSSQISIFCSPRSSRVFEFPASGKISEIECPTAERNRLYRWWWLENRLAAAVRKIGADVVLGMCGAGLAGAAMPHVAFI